MEKEYKFARNRIKEAPYCPCGEKNKGHFSPIEGTDGRFGKCFKGACTAGLDGMIFPTEEKLDIAKPVFKPHLKKELLYVPDSVVKRTFKGYEFCSLVKFLERLFPVNGVHEVLKQYNVGTYYGGKGNIHNGSAMFWYHDGVGFRKAKVMKYGSNGKRIRSEGLFPFWTPTDPVKSLRDSHEYSHCLYGQDSIRRDKTIALVESEKSAILGTLWRPKISWVATGGSTMLDKERAKPLAGRKVKILFDADQAGRKNAIRIKEILDAMDCQTQIVETFPERTDGSDIGDFIIEMVSKTVRSS